MFSATMYEKTISKLVESMNSALKGFITKDVRSLVLSRNNYMMKIYKLKMSKKV